MNRIRTSVFVLVLIGIILGCKDTGLTFSPGAGDPRMVGTWRLVERRFPRDSSYSVKVDTITIRRDTSFYATKRYPATPTQTLIFGSDGSLNASGSEMTYYYPVKYFRVDSTYEGLGVNLFISTNRANVPFRQNLEFRRDTLLLLPRCEQPCYLKLVRVK